MKTDEQGRIKYGGAWIKERADWRELRPVGPMSWDVWSATTGELIGEDIPANELPGFLVTRELLVQW